MMNTFKIRLGILIMLLLAAFSIRYVIIGGSTFVKLKPAQALAGPVSQTLGPNQSGSLWVEGKDFTLDRHYFDNNSWVVVLIKPTAKHTFDRVFEVFEKVRGVYQLQLGPGATFSSDQVINLPNDVAEYLSSNGALYVSVPL